MQLLVPGLSYYMVSRKVPFWDHCWTFNINDLFLHLTETDVCNYAGINAVIWFENNYMKFNNEKCHFLISGNKIEHVWAKMGKCPLWESRQVKLLGVSIDNELKFNEHVSTLFSKAGRKLTALIRLTRILPFDKKRTLLKSFVESQFAYSPLAGLFSVNK